MPAFLSGAVAVNSEISVKKVLRKREMWYTWSDVKKDLIKYQEEYIIELRGVL